MSTPGPPTPPGAAVSERATKDGAATRHAHKDAQKAMVRARMFGTAAATIGRFAILSVLGEGGMGTVYACFDDQLDRRVALKLVKGTTSSHARQRILREARAMATLSHPNVVPVFEVGEHLGRLYVAMEFIKGQALVHWQRDRDWREVVAAYRQAGLGLAAAHSQGLVHRDFKPHNAMVGDDDRVRVLDFGLVTRHGDPTAAGPTPTQSDAELTQTGQVMGTPAYMAPEQASAGTANPHSDQYSFCVALWEALYGARPGRDGDRGEDSPPRLRGVLERGLETDPTARWPDMSALLDALDSASIDPAKAASTRRRVLALGLGSAALVGAVLVVQQQLDRQRTARCESDAGDAAAALWNGERREAIRTAFGRSPLKFAEATGVRALPELDAYAERWREATAETCVATQVLHTLSPSLHARSASCLDERAQAFETTVDRLTTGDRDVVNTAVDAVFALPDLGICTDATALAHRTGLAGDSAESAARQALAEASALVATGRAEDGLARVEAAADHLASIEDTALRGAVSFHRGTALAASGRPAEAETAFSDAYFRAFRANDWNLAGRASTRLAGIVGGDLARPTEGLVWIRHAVAAWEALSLPGDDLRVARTELATAHLRSAAGELDEAQETFERVLATREAKLGPDHPKVAASLTMIAALHLRRGKFAEATELQRRAMALNEHAFGPDHPNIANDLNNIAVAAASTGDFPTALDAWLRALAINKAALGPHDPALALTLDNLGALYGLQGEWEKAERAFAESLEVREAALGPDHPDLAPSLNNIAQMHQHFGRDDEALVVLERAVAVLDASETPEPRRFAEALGALGLALRDGGDPARAAQLHARAAGVLEAKYGAEHSVVAREQARRARALAVDGAATDRVTGILEQALEVYARKEGTQEGELDAEFFLITFTAERGGDTKDAIARIRGLQQRITPPRGAEAKAVLPELEAWLSEHERARAALVSSPGG